jgi:cell division FtsZ-interacting protein ZapD
MSLKDTLLSQGMKLMSDPRLTKLLQNERVMKAVIMAMSMPGRAQTYAKEGLGHLVHAMSLATEEEVQDLQRTVRRLEDELSRLRADREANGGARRRVSSAE